MIDRDLIPLRRRAAAKAEGLGQRDDPAKLAGGLENDRIPFSHESTYSTAIPAESSPARRHIAVLSRQFGMDKESRLSFGVRLKDARKRAKKTQDDVAESLDLTKGAISQWETGVTVPELEYFRGFCLYTGASADEILLERRVDPLLRALVDIWLQLEPEKRDELFGRAQRLLSDHPILQAPMIPPEPKRNGKTLPKKAKKPRR